MLPVLLMSSWLSLATAQGGAVQYPATCSQSYELPLYTEMGVRFDWGKLFAEGSMRCDLFPRDLTAFSPYMNTYGVGAGLDFGWFKAGWRHVCFHPMIAYRWNQGPVRPGYEGAGDEFYITFKIDKVRLSH